MHRSVPEPVGLIFIKKYVIIKVRGIKADRHTTYRKIFGSLACSFNRTRLFQKPIFQHFIASPFSMFA